jgi:hypothetical protein
MDELTPGGVFKYILSRLRDLPMLIAFATAVLLLLGAAAYLAQMAFGIR